MMKISCVVMLIFTTGFLMSCGVASRQVVKKSSVPPAFPSKPTISSASESSTRHNSHSSLPPLIKVSKYEEVKVSLQQAYRDWKGTPYVWGGESLRGVDCSGFVQLIFKQYFGVKLPRSTKRQLYTGITVSRKNLKSGDLVFFKTGRKELHVGIFIHHDKFLNASVSEGVTISSLQDIYWKSHYMTARRVLQF
jgi:cell wall-associated NlpC family hydrolase